MNDELIYLDSYIVQKDMRIRLPKSILTNMNVEKGKSMVDFYFDKKQNALVLKLSDNQEVENGTKG